MSGLFVVSGLGGVEDEDEDGFSCGELNWTGRRKRTQACLISRRESGCAGAGEWVQTRV